ncbi:MAG: transcriptional regulator [Chloroflexota bacterium]|nr:transcriptional regulator [Chloroflexota bacterium]
MSNMTQDIQTHWDHIRPILSIRDEGEYDRAVIRLNQFIDEVGTDEGHPLYELLDTLGTLIHAYEEKQYRMPEASGSEVLQYLMNEHQLRQSDLVEVGSQGVVSEILSGKRELNLRQIRALAKRFNVSPRVFI